MKTKTFETSEEFKSYILSDFLTTLSGYAQGRRLSYNFPHVDICEVQIQSQFNQEVFSIWRSVVSGEVEWCKGRIGKFGDKQIN